MTVIAKVLALGSASIAAASVAYVVATSTGDAQPAGPDKAARNDGGPVVCAGKDSALRLVRDGKGCPPGEQELELVEAEEELMEWEDAGSDDAAKPDTAKSEAIAALERRVRELEQRPRFEVVDKEGRPIFTVAPENVYVYNANQIAVAAIRATQDGGYFVGRSPDGLIASVGASGLRSGLRVNEGGVTRSYAGKQAAGNYSLTFPSPATGNIAAIGESRAGTGAVVVGSFGGIVLASITGSDGKGAVGVSNQSGAPVVSLTEGATRGGLFAIGDATSEPMVKMGVAQDRYGIVLTGPRAGFPLIPASGLPGSYIMGCAGKGKDCGPEPTLGGTQ